MDVVAFFRFAWRLVATDAGGVGAVEIFIFHELCTLPGCVEIGTSIL
jgi:hypothetical protein